MKKSLAIPLIGFLGFFIAFMLTEITSGLRTLELTTLDTRFKLRGVQELADSSIVLVTIDDASFEALPERWPWPRDYYVKVIENLTKAGAKVIGIDVIFDQFDQKNPEGDLALAKQFQENKSVILARKFEQHPRLKTYEYLVEPHDMLKTDTTRLGLVSIVADEDGVFRRLKPAMLYREKYHLSFPIVLLRSFFGLSDNVEVQYTDAFFEYDGLGATLQNGQMLINFSGPERTFPSYSFYHVMDDSSLNLDESYDGDYFTTELLPDRVFDGKIVIIGSTVAELHDNFPTPFLNYYDDVSQLPGAEILANATHTLLHQQFLNYPNPWIFRIIVAVLVALIALISSKLNALRSSLIFGILIFAYIIFAVYTFVSMNLVIDIVFPLLAMSLCFVGINVYNYYTAERDRRRITDAFGHYVSPKLVKELQNDPDKLKLGGEERVLTVMFSDIENFTAIAEKLNHRELVQMLNDYFTEMSGIVLKQDGSIDKYIGDAIMAEFGAPVYYEDHAIKACRAALRMQSHLTELSREWRRNGRPFISSRIGINTGNMVVGNMGSASPKKFNYTVIGDEVNLAARLESANKVFDTKIMISESTFLETKNQFVTRQLDRIIVKGKSTPVTVYELIAEKKDALLDHQKTLLPLFEHGISFYETRDWQSAISIFKKCLRIVPDDGPSRLYLKRAETLMKNPPPPNWNRVFEMSEK